MKTVLKAIGWLVGLVLLIGLLVVGGLRAVTIPRVTQEIVHHLVPQWINGQVDVGRFEYHLLSSWPKADISLKNIIILSHVIESNDTLATIDSIYVSVELAEMLKARQAENAYWKVHLGDCWVAHPVVYGQTIDGQHNWNCLRETEKDTIQESDSLSLTWESITVRDMAVTYRVDRQAATACLSGSIALDSIWHLDSINARVRIPEITSVMQYVPKQYLSYLKGLTVAGGIDVSAQTSGIYHDDVYPTVQAQVNVNHLHGKQPSTNASFDDLSVRVSAQYNHQSKDSTWISLESLHFQSGKSSLTAQGRAEYRQQREYLDVCAKADLRLRELAQLYPMEDVRVRGRVNADINTYFYLDDLLNQRFYDVHSSSTLGGDDVFLVLRKQHFLFFVDSLRANLTTNMERVSRHNRKDTALLNARFAFSSCRLGYNREIRANINRFSVFLYADDLGKGIPPTLRTMFSLRGIEATLHDTTCLHAKRITCSANLAPDRQHRFRPQASVSLSMDSTIITQPTLGLRFDSTRFRLATAPRYRAYHYNRATRTRELIPDSLQPIINIDSMIHLTRNVLSNSEPTERYLKLFETQGHGYIKRIGVLGDFLPLRTSIRKVDLSFTDDTIQLDDFHLRMGRSAIQLKGEVTNFRRYLLRGKTLKADVSLQSRRIDLNQLARAMTPRTKAEVVDSIAAQDKMEELMQDTAVDSEAIETDSTTNMALIVLPKNINCHFKAHVDTVIMSKMQLRDFTGDVRLRKQALSIVNMSTSTQVGKAALNISYTCSNRDSAQAAVTLGMDSIQIGELIEYMPELDSILPMLSSFKGSVRCEMSAQTTLDSTMSIVLPSLNAAAYIHGEELVLMDGETFTEISKLLLFNKKTENMIDTLSVELMVQNNEVQIFPFMLSLDKYRVAAGGIQNLDLSFNYHISVLKPIPLGLDIYGQDFDHKRFKLVSPKYKNSSTKIGSGGNLIRPEDANLRKAFQNEINEQIMRLNQEIDQQ